MAESIRVLLIDDEVLFTESLLKVLRRRGMAVRTAPDGPTGLELLSKEESDVIVLDVRMPGMDGLATFKAIRELDPVTPVIILSGNIDMKEVSEALRMGCDEILLKPCPLDTLVTSIENAYERKCFSMDVAQKE
ncbi:response regulator [Syntrophobacter fumaroxidans]|uniref:Response regulator receiver protein n=1 Tax=Syntrophobacter fumaroxidans (strain DSM 10017 / MPOB) TaxID=335543 RepID=A0LFY0_SYNFM|nr:response regulator [Syntrophobacter fumaroxidans]ABK16332.1 response regulator receiver protein [Syntrophobacter fumaroxidans MPOB]